MAPYLIVASAQGPLRRSTRETYFQGDTAFDALIGP
jgi:hypothetical protein